MSRSQFAVYQLKKKPELRNLLFRTYEELAQEETKLKDQTVLVVEDNADLRKFLYSILSCCYFYC